MNRQYVTPKMIKDFNHQLIEKEEPIPSLPDLLFMMQKHGLLLSAPAANFEIYGKMTREEFMEAYDNIPFEASEAFYSFSKERELNGIVVFPPDTDILCMQQLHHNVYYDQTLHNVYAFTYVYKGACTYSFNRQTLSLSPGDIFIATPGFSHQVYTDSGTFALVIMFNSTAFNILFNDFLTADSALSKFFRQAIAKKENGNYCIISSDPDDEELRFYIQSMVCECLSNNVYSDSSATCLLKLFLSQAYIKYQNSLTVYRRNFPDTHADAKDILRYIQSNYQDITLSQVAEHFHYNHTYISRFIHTHCGKKFIDIINELKIQHACVYLHKTSLRISDIAGLVGFESYDHFCRTFRKYTGMTPGAYRSGLLTDRDRNSFK